jgi:hypothetical protein
MPGNPDRVRDLHRLADIWEGLGLRVRTMPDWENRGRSSGNTFEVLGCHHTGVHLDNDRVLRDGRPDVSGPLCNVALHANGDVVLVASGRANHFGVATWPSSRSLGVEATGPQKTAPRFPNRDAYVRLAVGFCIFKDNADPRRVVLDDVGIPVHLVAAHKEVAVDKETRKIYGRKPDPDFDEPGRIMSGALAHGFSASGSVRLIDTFRDDVHTHTTVEDDMFSDDDRDLLRKVNGMIDQSLFTRPEVNSALDDIASRVGVGTEATMKGIDDKLDQVLARLDAVEAKLNAP